MTEYERMISGLLYKANDEELTKMYNESRLYCEKYNNTSYLEKEKRNEIIRNWLGKIGKNFNIVAPFYADYGKNILIGENFYCNTGCTILDVAPVKIGDNVLIGPNVNIFAAGHPLDPLVRNTGCEFGTSINIGNNVWIGGNVTINPGVKIGDNTVIGSGSVVTKSLPSNTICAGNPCKIIRKLTVEDSNYWNKLLKEYEESTI